MANISLENVEVKTFIFYSAVLALKLLAVVVLTARQRFKKGVFANPEDLHKKGAKVKFDDQDVERVRRAHLNDLENIPVFWILGALYLTTSPEAWLAQLLFRLFAGFRILHTYVYAVNPLPQPSRAIAFFIPYVINWYMGVQIIMYYLSSW